MTERVVWVWRRNWLPGSETFIRNQVDSLQEWRAVCVGIAKRQSDLARGSDILLSKPGVRARFAWFSLLLFGASRKLAILRRREPPAIIHAHFGGDARGVDFFAARHRIPLVVTVHGSDILTARSKPGLAGLLYRFTTRRVLRRAAVVLALTEFMRDAVIQFEPRARVQIHPIGVPAVELAETGEGYDVLFVGRLEPVKGVRLVVETAEALRNAGEEARFAVVGDGSLRLELERLSREKDLDIDWLGMQPSDRVLGLMRNSKLLLAPSLTQSDGRTEAFGMVFLEAASQEIPCVAFESGGIGEAVVNGETGVLVREGDVSGLIEATRSLLGDDEARRRMGRAGRRRLEQDFDISYWSGRLESVYDSLANFPSSSPPTRESHE